MCNDFDLIVHSFDENRDIKIYPICDVHLGAAEHMSDEWNNFCSRIASEDAYVVLGGDLINNATRSSVSNIFEEVLRPSAQKRMMVKMLEPIRDRILCAVQGNHERRSMKDADDDPSYDIMAKLDLEHLYRQNIAFLKIRIGDANANGQKNPTYTLVVSHGAGGGAMTGSTVNRNERFGYSIDGADALIVGHSHKPFVTQPAKIRIDKNNNKVSIVPFKVICATSWLQYGGYAAQKLLLPSSFAPQTITLCGKKKDIKVEM